MKLVFGTRAYEGPLPQGVTTIGDIIANAGLQAVLGFGDNVEASINGVFPDLTYIPADTDTVVLTTKAGCKA